MTKRATRLVGLALGASMVVSLAACVQTGDDPSNQDAAETPTLEPVAEVGSPVEVDSSDAWSASGLEQIDNHLLGVLLEEGRELEVSRHGLGEAIRLTRVFELPWYGDCVPYSVGVCGSWYLLMVVGDGMGVGPYLWRFWASDHRQLVVRLDDSTTPPDGWSGVVRFRTVPDPRTEGGPSDLVIRFEVLHGTASIDTAPTGGS